MNRLDTVAPDIASMLRIASPAKRRAATEAAVKFAVDHAAVDDDVVLRSVDLLRSGDRDELLIAELQTLVNELEDAYFAREEDAKSGRIDMQDYLRAFAFARAAAAVAAAHDKDPMTAAFESIYEASHVVDDPEKLFVSVRRLLK